MRYRCRGLLVLLLALGCLAPLADSRAQKSAGLDEEPEPAVGWRYLVFPLQLSEQVNAQRIRKLYADGWEPAGTVPTIPGQLALRKRSTGTAPRTVVDGVEYEAQCVRVRPEDPEVILYLHALNKGADQRVTLAFLDAVDNSGQTYRYATGLGDSYALFENVPTRILVVFPRCVPYTARFVAISIRRSAEDATPIRFKDIPIQRMAFYRPEPPPEGPPSP